MKTYIVSNFNFSAKPYNYSKVDNYLTRSAQPKKEDFLWLKEQGVTDVFNFRTMYFPAVDFNEKETVESLGMKYHSIPSVTKKPSEDNVYKFLIEMKNIVKSKGKAHIHCMAGADRTGMYAFIYKALNDIGDIDKNLEEWIDFGHDRFRYPNLMDWAENFVNKAKHKL